MKKVLVTPRSFGKVTGEAFDILKNAGFDVFINPYGRIMTEPEMIEHIADMDAPVRIPLRHIYHLAWCEYSVHPIPFRVFHQHDAAAF